MKKIDFMFENVLGLNSLKNIANKKHADILKWPIIDHIMNQSIQNNSFIILEIKNWISNWII